jgi:hypothetical protein
VTKDSELLGQIRLGLVIAFTAVILFSAQPPATAIGRDSGRGPRRVAPVELFPE